MNIGNWIDVKMQIKWSESDSDGFVNVWVNGMRQTLRYTSMPFNFPTETPKTSPGTIFTGRTVVPNQENTGVYYKEGLYRQKDVGFPTGIIYHGNFRTASDEASL